VLEIKYVQLFFERFYWWLFAWLAFLDSLQIQLRMKKKVGPKLNFSPIYFQALDLKKQEVYTLIYLNLFLNSYYDA
jgi:hypothetical protein